MKTIYIFFAFCLLSLSCDETTTDSDVTLVLSGSLQNTRVALIIDEQQVFDGYVTTELTTSVAASISVTLSNGRHTISCVSPVVAETTFTVGKNYLLEVMYTGDGINFILDPPGYD
ncbi:hypothetical protein JNL27_14465 [bacterium]|nr:hypothetical protein [bacterium]